MEIQNSELIDPEQGIFSILGLVTLRLGGPYWWQTEDIDEETAIGAIFRAYERENLEDDVDKDVLDVASITVVDVTDDPSERDVSLIEQADIPLLDESLHMGIEKQLAADGMKLTKWMSSHLNKSESLQNLVTAYIANDQGKERQFIAVRMKVKGRKVVAVGIFDIAKKDKLAAPVFNILKSMAVIG